MSGISGVEAPPELSDNASRALKLQTDTPHLVNIGGDRLSTSVTLHPIPQGRVTLGSGAGVDIPVHGTGVLPMHCHIENSEGVVTIYPLSDNLLVDGVKIFRPTRLSQGVMLTIGRSNYMRFNHPAEAKIMKSVLPNPRISVAPLNFEPDQGYQPPKSNKKPPVAPKKNSREIESGVEEPAPSSIMTKVSKFEYLAQQNFKKCISPKVFSSNLVTVNTPAKDVLGKQPPDLQNFTKNMPRNALNYSELNSNDKEQSKIAERPMIFGKKSPQYVNVALNDTKNINNRVIIYENGCIPKQNVNLDFNELNNKPSSGSKNINISRVNTPSPNYNRNLSPYARSVTPSPVPNGARVEHRRSGSLGEVSGFNDALEGFAQRNNEAEMRRTQAQKERIMEQEMEKAEQARLEEIVNMCVEYEKQAQNEKNKITPNRIKTNGSLPRDKRQYSPLTPTYTTPPPSPSTPHHDNSYDNVIINRTASHEKVDTKSVSPYENVQLNLPSPRTRIKTTVSHRDTAEIIENKFAVLETEQYLLQNSFDSRKQSPVKFIFPLEEPDRKFKVEDLKREKRDLALKVSNFKRQLAEFETQEEELYREIELESALIAGEHESKLLEMEKLERTREKFVKLARQIEDKMQHCQVKQEKDQEECKKLLDKAQKEASEVERRLSTTQKTDPVYEELFERYLKAQEVLDNERKVFEDLEFHHLEEEADWLASREELQREIVDQGKRVDSIKEQLIDLEQQKQNVSASNNSELKMIKTKRLEYQRQLEKLTGHLRSVENELSQFSQESEQEESTDSDSDKQSLHHDLSCSMVVMSGKIENHHYNMSQSFNEKLLQEKSVLESATKYPSQDDIDRISKVTSNAPLNINEEKGSLGRKTIESLRDIERKRHLHLCQQGSQVIEQERQRVLALKQRVQQEVRSKWEKERRGSMDSLDEQPESKEETEERKTENPPAAPTAPVQNDPVRSSSDGADSPRPMSEISEMSVEIGGTGRKRLKSPSDKQRPLTRYLPIRGSDLDLRQHIESAGHQVVLCPHVIITSSTCRGFLCKKGSKLNKWSKRWFVFDRNKHTFTYYNDKSEKKPRGGAYFQAIEEVYLDHLNSVKSPNPQLTFIVKTHERFYYLMAPSPEAMRIWVDVIFTGAEGYQEFDNGT